MKTLIVNKYTLAAAVVATAVCGARADVDPETPAAPANAEVAEAEKGETEETPIVSATFALAFDSKYLSYGFVDNRDPILTPSAEATFFDTLTIGVEAIFDTTKYGRKAGYGNHAGRYTELHPYIGLGHSFSDEDYEWLPTTIDVSLTYLYEYHPESKDHGDGEDEDSQFWTLEISAPDCILEPTLAIERDTVRDNGTYVNLELGHTFNLLGEDDDTLTLRPSVAQGFGNCERVKAYVGECDHPANKNGLMDTLIKLELAWNVCDNVAVSGYVGYSDFLFDRDIRRASRSYEATGRCHDSYNFIGGLGVELSF